MAQLITVQLNKAEHQPLGFRLQGGKDFGTPLVVQKVNGGSAAERAGLQAGDALIRVNNTEVYSLRHQEAQDAIRAAGANLELIVQRGGGTWRPTVTPTGSLPRPSSRPLGGAPALVTNTSLKATPQPSRAFGSGHNNVAKPFGYMNGNDSVKSIVNKQYNTPVNMYSDKTIAETLSAQTEVLAGGVLGVNFKKNEKTYDAEKSAVFKVLQEEQNDPEPEVAQGPVSAAPPPPVSGLRPVQAPVTRPDAPVNNTGGLPPGQNICEECERLITGVFVRIKDKNLHVECFKCSTCGTSLKNQGYYNLNGKLYCDIHAKLVARQNPPAPNLDPVTVPPGGRIPTNTYSTPLPPLATSNYTNGSSSLFSPSSNLSGPKPFGSSIGSAYSPSLSPRSAPMSPARPVTAPAYAPAPAPTYAPAPAPAYAPAYAPAPAPAPAPVIAPPAAAPFAPTQNVKSVVWPPPPISSDDEPPKCEPNQILANSTCNPQPTSGTVNKICSNLGSNVANIQQQVMEQSITSSTQREAFTSSVSYASAAVSSVPATSKSESIVQSNQSQLLQETSSRTIQSSVKSFSQESSDSQSFMNYETQENPVNKIENIRKTKLTKSKEAIEEKSSTEVQLSNTRATSQVNIASDMYQNNTADERYEQKNTEGNPENYDTKSIGEKTNQIVQDTEIINQSKRSHVTQDQQNVNSDVNYAANTENRRLTGNPQPSNELTKIELLHANTNVSSSHRVTASMVDALTTAPDRPYSPLPPPPQPISTMGQMIPEEKLVQNHLEQKSQVEEREYIKNTNQQLPSQPASIIMQEPKRGITPIPPITPYNPPENIDPPVPMPEETKPYIPPDFKIVVEPKVPRELTSSPLIDALTTAPNRPFTPIMSYNEPIYRGSLREALTIAPDRPYSPFYSNNVNKSSQYKASSTAQTYATSTSDIVKPIATQTSTQSIDKVHSELSTIQNTCKLQSSSEISAFKPVAKQVFPPLQPEEFCKLTNFPPISNELQCNFTQSMSTKQETALSESMTMQQSSFSKNMPNQAYSSVKSAQNYFEHLDKKESFSSTAVRNKSGLHKPDSIPPYQRNFEQLPSQRGITPELYSAPAVLQRPVTPTTDPPTKPREKSLEPNPTHMPQNPTYATYAKIPQIKTPVQQQPLQFYKETPITMTFQPVSDDNIMRTSPLRSRPTTPSLINKPAPVIPHYQMNLVSVEHTAPESHLYDPSSREPSRSPTPKPRSRSPAQGPPPNPLKAQAPRIKEFDTPNYTSDSNMQCMQDTPSFYKEREIAQQSAAQLYNSGNIQNWGQNQSPVIREQMHSSTGYKSENYTKGDMKYKEDSMINANYGQRQMQSQNVVEHGNTTVHTTRKTFEEFERTQSAKVIEIRKGGSSISGAYEQMESNIRPPNINAKQVFPPPLMSLSTTQQNSSLNLTNENIATASRTVENYEPKPSISGANLGPVCDPTPSTGSSVGAAARGKTFGVSSAPKRGRGVLNKAALPGSRVPLCASCNGHIRGPFITALGRIWCPEHFICVNATCRRPLQDIGFVEENGQLYCEFCFEQYIAPACDKCHAKIKGDCLNAIGKHYHPECFNCVYCGKLFGNNPFFLEDGLPYCEADWNELFTTKCFACGFPVEAGDRWVEALNNNYHSQCFNCTVCKKNLEGQSFFAKGGRPFCKTHAR